MKLYLIVTEMNHDIAIGYTRTKEDRINRHAQMCREWVEAFSNSYAIDLPYAPMKCIKEFYRFYDDDWYKYIELDIHDDFLRAALSQA